MSLPFFIPSYHRADRLASLSYLKKRNQPPGEVYVFIDDEGGDEEEYRRTCRRYGANLVVFNQQESRDGYDYVHRPSKSRRSGGQARNMMWKYAVANGIEQYVVIDDDSKSDTWRPFGMSLGKYSRMSPAQFQRIVDSVAAMQRRHRLGIFGLSQNGEMFYSKKRIEQNVLRKKVMNFSFYLTSLVHGGERGVQDNDTSQFVTAMQRGLLCASFATGLTLNQCLSATQPGGLTDLYKECHLLNKALVTVIQNPSAIRAVKRKDIGGRVHHHVDYRYLMPKILRVKEGNNIAWDTYPEDVPFTNIPNRKWEYVE